MLFLVNSMTLRIWFENVLLMFYGLLNYNYIYKKADENKNKSGLNLSISFV